MKKIENALEQFIFFSRWIQLPVYIGLIVASLFYAIKFMIMLWKLVTQFGMMNENTILLSVLGLIDISMVINLLVVFLSVATPRLSVKLNLKTTKTNPSGLEKLMPVR